MFHDVAGCNTGSYNLITRYSTDYGKFRFCIAATEHDWREGTEQYQFIEHCLASVDRQKQPWFIFLAHRVLGYSSSFWCAAEGSFAEPMGRDSLQKLWQKYKVDMAIYGHVHKYQRTCPIYQVLSQFEATKLHLVIFLLHLFCHCLLEINLMETDLIFFTSLHFDKYL